MKIYCKLVLYWINFKILQFCSKLSPKISRGFWFTAKFDKMGQFVKKSYIANLSKLQTDSVSKYSEKYNGKL